VSREEKDKFAQVGGSSFCATVEMARYTIE
jgi:hypothetical protein